MTDRPNQDLARAIAEAAARVDPARQEAGAREVSVPRRRGSASALLAVLALLVALGSVLPRHFAPAPPAPRQVEDLRWSVAAVVRGVEAFRVTRGRLPRPEEITPLLGGAVRYLPGPDGYRVEGAVEGARVTFDSREMPAALWLEGEAQAGGPAPHP